MTGEDKTTPGILQMLGEENGMPDKQQWFVMLSTEDTFIAYYCGGVLTWSFEGLLVMSKTQELNPEREKDLERILEDLGIGQDELCVPDLANGCKNKPEIFVFDQ